MVTLRRHWQAVFGVAAIVVGVALGMVAVAGLTRGESQPAIPTQRGIAATVSVSQPVLLFGDPLIARFVVVVDRARINPRLVRIDSAFEPFEPIEDIARTRRDQGDLTELTFTQTLRCIVPACLPPISEKLEFTFPESRVMYRDQSQRGNFEQFVTLTPTPVSIASRFNVREIEESRAANPVLTFEPVESGLVAEDVVGLWRESAADLPETSYRISPTLLVAILFTLALLSTAAAGGLVIRQLRPEASVPEPVAPVEPPASPLEDALGQLDVALANGHVDEQRKALERLARELGSRGEDALAGEARQLAWSEADPARDEARALARTVRSTVDGSSNGQPA
jgi:hypothetical protein